MAGWIYDFRKELESNIWIMPPMYHRVWQWIKYSVNHADFGIPNKDGGTTIIKAGQRATSYRQIAKGVGYYEGKSWKEPNVKTIKSILDWMVKQKMISVRGNTEGTIITIEKWELYQKDLVKGNTERITPATRRKHLADTNNKGLINDELMISNRAKFSPPTIKEITDYCSERRNMVDPNKFFDFYESKGWYVGKNKMKDWKAAVRNWEKSSQASGRSKSDKHTVEKQTKYTEEELERMLLRKGGSDV